MARKASDSRFGVPVLTSMQTRLTSGCSREFSLRHMNDIVNRQRSIVPIVHIAVPWRRPLSHTTVDGLSLLESIPHSRRPTRHALFKSTTGSSWFDFILGDSPFRKFRFNCPDAPDSGDHLPTERAVSGVRRQREQQTSRRLPQPCLRKLSQQPNEVQPKLGRQQGGRRLQAPN
jgi:hypothetical protein